MAWAGGRRWHALTIGVDIGGTKVAAGVVTPSGTVLARRRTQTPGRDRSPAVVEDTIAGLVAELTRGHRVRAVGIGAAGFVDAERSSVLFAPHLSWRNEPLRAALSERTGLAVVVDNDANAAAWAEMHWGAGRQVRSAVLVNVGTGIGGAVIIDGELYRGGHGLAGEFGHMTVVAGGHRCECGNRGCWEQYASGSALARDAAAVVETTSTTARGCAGDSRRDSARFLGVRVTELARAGDRACVELLDDTGQWLGRGLANLAAAFDPELFIVGGGLAQAGDLLLHPARRALSRSLAGRGYRPEPRIVPGALGEDAGLVGAAGLAREALSMRQRLPRPARSAWRSRRVAD